MWESNERRRRLDRLYREHATAVLAYVRRTTPDDAPDVVAETFVVAWRRLDDLTDDAEALPWLYGIAWRTLSTQRRSARRQQAISERLAKEPQPPASEPTSHVAMLGAALAGLAASEREVLMLVAWEELDSRQAAAVLGCTPTAFRLRLHRARRHLRRRLSDHDPEPAPLSPRPVAPAAKETP
jgi:RNA polymerase sigma-70 factor (ECF subfamily)